MAQALSEGLAALAEVAGRHWLAALLLVLPLVLAIGPLLSLRRRIRAEREQQLQLGLAPAPAQPAVAAAGSGAELRELFRDALGELRAHLGRAGPYALPWFAVLGEDRSGKSALLHECGLDVPARFERRGFGATGSCEFVLSNEAIAIDTPGRWFRAAGEPERGEWLQFLALLRQSRPECPLNGVLVALCVPLLLGRSAPELEAKARELRRRLNELRVELALDAPIYLVLTQADALDGFAELARGVPREWTAQAFGWTNDQRRLADPGGRVLAALAALAARVEALVPELLMRERDPLRQRRLFGLPRELEALGQRVAEFAGHVFQRDRYGEPPFLRGVYFTSARAKGSGGSLVLARLGLRWAQAPSGEEALGPLFLRDLVREVVCGDEPLALRERRLGPRARRAAAAAAALLALGVLAIWGASFAQNYQGARALAQLGALALEPAPALAELGALRARIEAEAQRAASPLHWLGFRQLAPAVERARAVYAFAFERSFHRATRERLRAALAEPGGDGLRALIAQAADVEFLARCGAGGQGAPDWREYLPEALPGAAGYPAAYAAYVAWLPPEGCRERLREAQLRFEEAAAGALDLPRLERLDGELLAPVRYADLGLRGDSRSSRVPGLYTPAGSALVGRLIDAVERAGAGAPAGVAEFARRYGERYEQSWRAFLFGAQLGGEPRFAPKSSPALALLDAVDLATRAPLPRQGEPMPWMAQLHSLRGVVQTAVPSVGADASAAAPPAADASAAPPDAGAAADAPPARWQRYLQALEELELELEPAARSPERALQQARELAEGNPGAFGPALQAARALLPAQGELELRRRLGELVREPVNTALGALLGRAREELQRRWVSKIARPYGAELSAQSARDLYGAGGALEQFVQAELAPFLQAGRPRPLLGGERALPLGPRWLAWLEYAGRQRRELSGAPPVEPPAATAPPRSVRLRGVPSRVQRSAQTPAGLRVRRRELRFVCPESDELQLFVYQEGTGEAALRWAQSCEEVSLIVQLIGPGSEGADELRASWPTLDAFRAAAERVSGRVLAWPLPGPLGSMVHVQYELAVAGAAPPSEPRRPAPQLPRLPPASLAD